MATDSVLSKGGLGRSRLVQSSQMSKGEFVRVLESTKLPQFSSLEPWNGVALYTGNWNGVALYIWVNWNGAAHDRG